MAKRFKKDIKVLEKIWQDVINKKAIAFNREGCSVSGEEAKKYSPFFNWKVCYLNSFEAYYLSDGLVEKEQ